MRFVLTVLPPSQFLFAGVLAGVPVALLLIGRKCLLALSLIVPHVSVQGRKWEASK